MADYEYIRVSELEPTYTLGLSDLLMVSQFREVKDAPENEQYVSKKISSDVLTKHIYNQLSGKIEERIDQEIGKIGKIGDVISQLSTISTDLGDAISAILGLDACRIKFKAETERNISALSAGLQEVSSGITGIIDEVSTSLSNEVRRNLSTVSADIYTKIDNEFYKKTYIDENIYTKTQTNNLVSCVSSDVLSQAKNYTDGKIYDIQDEIDDIQDEIDEINSTLSNVSSDILLQAKNYTGQEIYSLRETLTSYVTHDQIGTISSQIKTDISNTISSLIDDSTYTKEEIQTISGDLTTYVNINYSPTSHTHNLSSQQWILYTSSLTTPLTVNVVLSVTQ